MMKSIIQLKMCIQIYVLPEQRLYHTFCPDEVRASQAARSGADRAPDTHP